MLMTANGDLGLGVADSRNLNVVPEWLVHLTVMQ